MKIASDDDDILSFFLLMVHTVITKKISPVWAYLHTFLTVCHNFFNFLIAKIAPKKIDTKFGSFQIKRYHFFGCGG